MGVRLNRRHFLGTASGAAALSVLAPHALGASTGDDPLGVRNDFAATSEYTFLNTAYIGLISRPALEAGRAWLDARAHRPYEVKPMLAEADKSRHLFARLINATDDEIGLLSSTTEGENVVTDALDFKPGENVVIDDLVYPSTPVIYRSLEKTKGIELRIVRQRGGATSVNDFARLVDKKTRLISVGRGFPISTVSGTTCEGLPIWRMRIEPFCIPMPCKRWEWDPWTYARRMSTFFVAADTSGCLPDLARLRFSYARNCWIVSAQIAPDGTWKKS